jgi:enoyl-CoA hydratase
MTAPESTGIVARRDGAVLTLTLSRPERLNAVTDAVLDRLADAVESLDTEVRAVVVTGAGRAFCAGADLAVTSVAADGSAPTGTATVVAANRVVRAITRCPVPIVAAVNGPAVGVGASIALACDIVVAARSAYLLLPFTDIALLPDGGATALLAASVGRNRALALSLSPERTGAEDALRMGVVHRVVDDESLATEAHDLALKLARGSRAALAATKSAINAATLPHLDDALERELEQQSRLVDAPDFAEAVAAFGERRPARFGE